jgi:hypothetical protein
MITVGTPLAGAYTTNGQMTIDYTGVVIAVDNPDEDTPDITPDIILVTILFHGGRTEHYITDANGHGVDTGMTPEPCTTAHEMTPLNRH